MTGPAIEGMQEAEKAVLANTTPRQFELDKLRQYVKGTQYEGRPSFFNDDVPLRTRAPSVVYPIVAMATSSHIDMCLGEGRWEGLTVETSDDGDDPLAATTKEGEELDKLLGSLWKRAGLGTYLEAALRSAMHEKSVAVIVSSLPGSATTSKLRFEVQRARNCKPTFDTLGAVSELEICYPYIDTSLVKDGNRIARAMIYRRTIDGVADRTYKPAEARVDGLDPKWVVAEEHVHKLGFCPVHWFKFDPDLDDGTQVDGNAVHQTVLDEIDCLNFALSVWNRAAVLAGDPQVVETGVPMDWNPSDEGRIAEPTPGYVTGKGIAQASGPSRKARKKGPGSVWRYENPDAKVGYLTIPSDALKAISDNGGDLRAKLQEVLGVVFTDPATQKQTEVSGRALREHHKRQVERCNGYRKQFETGLAAPVTLLALRLIVSVIERGSKFALRGVEKAQKALARLLEAGGPDIHCVWLPYFDFDGEEQNAELDATIEAKNAGLITLKTAVERIAAMFKIDNVDEYVRELEQLKKDEQDEALRQMQALGQPGDGDERGNEAGGKLPSLPNAAPRPGIARRGAVAAGRPTKRTAPT